MSEIAREFIFLAEGSDGRQRRFPDLGQLLGLREVPEGFNGVEAARDPAIPDNSVALGARLEDV